MTAPVLLPWFDGVSRETGTPVGDPSGFTDLRNIEFFPGAVRLREGLGPSVATVSAPVVCAVQVFSAYALACWVLYDPATRDVTVVTTDLQGQQEGAVGTWGTLDLNAEEPPRFVMAEAYGIMVFAHDEPNVQARLETYRFDPPNTGNEWQAIEADLDGLGLEPVKFRGVVQHLGAIWGWGFGTDSDPDRPELIRRSNPDDPTVYQAQSFFQVGVRLDPIIAVCPVAGSLAILKGSSWYRLDGATSAEFTLQLVDPVIGCVGARAVLNVNGVLYWWSPMGPKATSGASTQDVASPLDLTGPLPAELPVPGPGAWCWAYQDPATYRASFVFPDPQEEATETTAFTMSLRDPSTVRWSYDVWGALLLCGALTTTGAGSFLIPPGHADSVTVTGTQGTGDPQITVTWVNVACVGDESVEIWAAMNAGPYGLVATVPVNLTVSPQVAVVTHPSLTNGTVDVALRMRRMGRYDPAYADPDPALWPAGSQASGTITVIATPVFTSDSYTPATETLALAWTMATATADLDVELTCLETVVAGTDTPTPVAGGGPTMTTFAPGTVSFSGTTLGPPDGYLFPADVWQAGGLVPGDILAAARARGYFLRVRLRGRIGPVVGDWSAPVEPFIGHASSPTDGSLPTEIVRHSVFLGTRIQYDWTDSAAAAGATAVRTMAAMAVGASPANLSPCTGYGPTAARIRALNVTTPPNPLSPPVAPAPTCATCQAPTQVVGLRDVVYRQQITAGGLTHWTTLSPAYGGLHTVVCGP